MKTYEYKVVLTGYIEAENEDEAEEKVLDLDFNDYDGISIKLKKDNDYTKDELGYVGMSEKDFI